MSSNNPDQIQQVQQPPLYQQVAPSLHLPQQTAPKVMLNKSLNWSKPTMDMRAADVESSAKGLLQNIRKNLSNLRHLHKALIRATNADLPYQKEYLYKTEEYNALLNDLNELERGKITQDTIVELKIVVNQLAFDQVRIDSIFPEITDKAMQMEAQMTEILDTINFEVFHSKAAIELSQIKASEQKIILENQKSDARDEVEFSISSAVYIIGIFNEMKASEKQIISLKAQSNQRGQRTKNSFLIGMATIILAFIILLCSFYYLGITWKDIKDYPILGIPLGVCIWSFVGSFAAMLTQFNKEPIHKFGDPFKWVIIRPVLGIVMGAAIYLALFSLVLTGKNQNPLLPLLVAFFVGYSDTFTFNIMASIQNVIANLFNSADHNDIKNNVPPIYIQTAAVQAPTVVAPLPNNGNKLGNNPATQNIEIEQKDPLEELKNIVVKDANKGEDE